MRPLDQIPAGASTSPPAAEQLSSLAYGSRLRAGLGSAGVADSATTRSVIVNAAVNAAKEALTVTNLPVLATGSGDQSAASTAVAPFLRLVPSSNVQFLDITISADGLSRTVGRFTEDQIETETGTRTVLVDVGRDAGDDGVVWHPLTKRPLGPDEFLTVSGFAGLEPFLDNWVPLPYLRFRGRSSAGQVVSDPGPSNWARAYIASPREGLRAAKSLQVVLAFDTKLAPVYATGDAADVGPTAYDALFGSTFQFSDRLADLGVFVSEPWIDTWLQGNFRDHARRASDMAGLPISLPGRFSLEHVARYLTYLAVLSRGTTLPQIRFADSFSNAWQMPVTGVDLVLDMSAEKTSALLIMRDSARSAGAGVEAVLAGAEALRVRDLNDPVRIHSSPPSTTIEFDAQNFGNIVASRRSGRTDAFNWPSLVRVGAEAERLALRTSATPGVTGRQGLFANLNEIAMADTVWRFSRDDAAGVDQGPIVAGAALSHLTEDGSVIGRFDQVGLPALRPRFSESSLIGLFVGELLMHALVQINRPHMAPVGGSAEATPRQSSTEASVSAVRQLQRILVTVASGVADEDRRLLQTRIEGAIDLIWTAMGWDDEAAVACPPKPQVSLGIGSDVAAQLVYVFDEITSRFGGDATEYLQTLRRPAAKSANAERAQNAFRIARLDFEAASTGLTIVDYNVSNDGGVHPTIRAVERSVSGRDRVLTTVANNAVWPAITDQLKAAGIVDPLGFISGLMTDGGVAATRSTLTSGSAASGSGAWPVHFGRRFDGKVIRAAAESCLQACETAAARAVDATRVFTLKSLVARGGGRLNGLANHFDAAAAAAGAANFRLADVTVRLRQRQAADLIRHAIEPVVGPLCDVIVDHGCDLVLLEGRMVRLPDLIDDLRRRLRLPSHCLVDVGQHPAAQALGLERDGPMIGAVGAYLASQQALQSGKFKLLTADIATSLQHYRPAAIARSGRTLRLRADAQPTETQPSLPPLVAGSSAGSSGRVVDGDRSHGDRSQGLLVRAGADLVDPNLIDATHSGPPRRRYAGERDQ